jgi:hypothetical protein
MVPGQMGSEKSMKLGLGAKSDPNLIQHSPGVRRIKQHPEESGRKAGSHDETTILLEARIGVEPTNKGFADLCLTTWLPRLADTSWIPHNPVRRPDS